MSVPRKNFNYSTPYAKPVQTYPSQSEDYISFDMGGQTQPNCEATSSNEKTPGRYNPKYYQQNNRNSNSKANRRSLFNNSYGQQNNRQNYNQNQQQRYGQRSGNERPKFHQKNNKIKNDEPISSFCHPSMTEDPWFDLMQRIKALDSSKISIKSTSPHKDTSTPPPDTSCNSETDNEEVDSAASD